MGGRFGLATLLVAGVLAGAPAAAADEVRQERVAFPAGSTGTTVEGGVTGYDSVQYVVAAGGGQAMTATLQSDNPMAYFNVFAPGDLPDDRTALFAGAREGDQFRETLRETGDYTIQTFLMRAGARRGETATYTLEIGVTGAASQEGSAGPVPDFADGLTGGPDLWEVTGLVGSDTVNLRAGPSTREDVLARFPTDTVLKNLGCRMVAGQRWCEVERQRDPSVRGWVAGRYLREAAAATDAAGGDAPVPGTEYNATGELPCALAEGQPTRQCPFGVLRQGGGTATVVVSWPDGRIRSIFFRGGAATGSDASAADGGGGAFASSRESDRNLIRVGAERYEIPDVVVQGN